MPHITTHSPKETRALGARFAGLLAGGEVLGIRGPLGAGKTEFVRGILRALGMKEPVTSPTFVLAKHYAITRGHIRHVIHIDAYRLEKPEGIYGTEALDYWGRPDAVIIVEWPERLAGLTTTPPESVEVDRGKENIRYWVFEKPRARQLSRPASHTRRGVR